MENPFSNISPNFTKSPLGVIALFILLVYGIATSSSIFGKFTSDQMWVMLVFLVSFPFIVLAVFHNLVTKHPDKIYGPGDFQSDEGFQAYRGDAPAEVADAESDTSKIINWINNHKENRGRLKKWLESQDYGNSVTFFLYQEKEAFHSKAVKHFIDENS